MTNLASKKAIDIAFNKLVLADENLRSGDEADPLIPELAETLINDQGKSLQLLPLFVKPTTDGFAILDGRRRWMGYSLLIAAGRINESFKIRAIPCETEAEIAQAVIVANTQRLEVSESDELLTLNKLISEKFTVSDMARALGRSEKDVRQKLVLARLDAAFLVAHKTERLSYRALRNIARIKDGDRLDALKARVEAGGEIHDYEFNGNGGAMTVNHPLFKVISTDAYVAAGGQIETDLFEELPGKILNPDIAIQLFDEALAPSKAFMSEVGIHGYVFGGVDWAVYDNKPWNFKSEATDADLQALHEELFGKSEDELDAENADDDDYEYDAEFEHEDFGEEGATIAAEPLASEPVQPASPQVVIDRFNDDLIKLIRYEVAKSAPLNIRLISFTTHFDVSFHFHRTDIREYKAKLEAAVNGVPDEGENNSSYKPAPKIPPVDTKGYSNTHHERTTRMCGQALSVSLRTNALVCLGLQIATQFRAALRSVNNHHDASEDILTLRATMAITGSKKEEPQLSQLLTSELTIWKDRFLETEKTYLQFVLDLALPEMLELFSVVTALQVDLTEIRTDYQNSGKRRQAVEVAEVLGHRFEQIMIPSVDYFRGFKKPALLSFVREMGVDTADFEKLKTGPLQDAVAELAVEHRFVPPHLNPMVGVAPVEDADEGEPGDDGEGENLQPHDPAIGEAEGTTNTPSEGIAA